MDPTAALRRVPIHRGEISADIGTGILAFAWSLPSSTSISISPISAPRTRICSHGRACIYSIRPLKQRRAFLWTNPIHQQAKPKWRCSATTSADEAVSESQDGEYEYVNEYDDDDFIGRAVHFHQLEDLISTTPENELQVSSKERERSSQMQEQPTVYVANASAGWNGNNNSTVPTNPLAESIGMKNIAAVKIQEESSGVLQHAEIHAEHHHAHKQKTRFGLLPLAVLTVFASVMNRVTYKMQLIPIGRLNYLIAILGSAFYCALYWSILYIRKSRNKVTAEMMEYARSNYGTFAIIGLFEALTYILQVYSASHLPGALLPVLSQTLLLFTMVASYLILQKKYDKIQIGGVGVVLLGVLTCVFPQAQVSASTLQQYGTMESVLKYSSIFSLSTAFLAFAMILKERVFRNASGKLDLFVVNSHGSLAQFLVTLLFLPFNLKFLLNTSMSDFFQQSWTILSGQTSSIMPWATIAYFVLNSSFNIGSLKLMRDASAVQALLAGLIAVPLSSLVFTLPWPLLTPSSFSIFTVFGLALLGFGIVCFNHQILDKAWKSKQ